MKRLLISIVSLLLIGQGSLAYAQTEGQPPAFNATTMACVKEIAKVDDIIDLDANTLTDAQIDELDEKCFKTQGNQPENQPAPKDIKWAKPTEDCLVKTFGSLEAANAAFAKKYSKEEARTFRRTVDKCLGKNVGIGKPEGLDEFKKCVTSAVGEAEAKKMLESFTPPAPGSELSKKVQAAGCGKKMQHQFNGDRPQMPKEMKDCFIKNGFNPDSQVVEDVGEAKIADVHKACNLGGPNGGDPEAAKKMMECLKEKGIDPKQASRGAGVGVVGEAEKTAFDECGKKFGGFHAAGQGGPGGPGMPENVKNCLKENNIPFNEPNKPVASTTAESPFKTWVRNNFIASAQQQPPQGPPPGQPGQPGQPGNPPQGGQPLPELNEEQRQAAQKCFGNNGPGGQGGPGDEGNAKRKECEDQVGFKPEPGKPMPQEKADALRKCFEEKGFANFGPGPGGPNGPQNGPQGGPNCGEPPKGPEVKGTSKIRRLIAQLPGQGDRQQPPQGQGGQPNCGPGPQGPNQPNNGQPGPNNQPGQPGQNGPQGPQNPGPGQQPGQQNFQSGNFPPNVQQCARDKGINLDNPDKEAIRRQIEGQCPQGNPGQFGGNPPPPNGQQPGPQGPPPEGQQLPPPPPPQS